MIDNGVCRRIVELLMNNQQVGDIIFFNCFPSLFFRLGISLFLGCMIIKNLPPSSQSVVSAALRAVGNIVTGDDIQTQVSFSGLGRFYLYTFPTPRLLSIVELCHAFFNYYQLPRSLLEKRSCEIAGHLRISGYL